MMFYDDVIAKFFVSALEVQSEDFFVDLVEWILLEFIPCSSLCWTFVNVIKHWFELVCLVIASFRSPFFVILDMNNSCFIYLMFHEVFTAALLFHLLACHVGSERNFFTHLLHIFVQLTSTHIYRKSTIIGDSDYSLLCSPLMSSPWCHLLVPLLPFLFILRHCNIPCFPQLSGALASCLVQHTVSIHCFFIEPLLPFWLYLGGLHWWWNQWCRTPDIVSEHHGWSFEEDMLAIMQILSSENAAPPVLRFCSIIWESYACANYFFCTILQPSRKSTQQYNNHIIMS